MKYLSRMRVIKRLSDKTLSLLLKNLIKENSKEYNLQKERNNPDGKI